MIIDVLVAAAVPIAKRVLVGLGFGVASFAGFQAVFTLAVRSLENQYGSISADVLGFLYLGGVPQAMSVVLGGVVGRFALMQAKRLQLL